MHGDGTALGSRYTLVGMIGQGGMGVVWRALDRVTGEERAVKVLRPELAADPAAVTRFVRERTALLRVRHPNVVTVHDLVVEGDRLALVMDMVTGEDLAEYRGRRGGALAPAEAAWLVGQVCAALVAVHEAGLVHRDLKPANVLLDHSAPEAPVRLADFGVARIASGDDLTATGNIVGTPRYMAPEVLEGHEPGPPADVYAAGVTLYELLAGRQPFGGGSISAVLHEHLHVPPPPLPGLPPELWTLLEQSLEKQPMARIGAFDLGRRLIEYARANHQGRFAITVPAGSGQKGGPSMTGGPSAMGGPSMTGGPSGTHPGASLPNGTFPAGASLPQGASLPPGSSLPQGASLPQGVFMQQGAPGMHQGGLTGPGGSPDGTLAGPRKSGGPRRGTLIGVGAAVVAAVTATGVTLALTGGGGGSDKGQAKAAAEASHGTLTAGKPNGSATPSGKGKKKSPGATPSASGSGSASPSGSPGASPSSGAPKSSGPGASGGGGGNAPQPTDWQCGPRVQADRRAHFLTACIRFDGQSVRLRATLDPTASRDDPKLIAANQMQIILVLKRAADQTNAGRWTSPPCATLVCTWETSTIPAKGKYRVLPEFSYQGIYQGNGQETPTLTY